MMPQGIFRPPESLAMKGLLSLITFLWVLSLNAQTVIKITALAGEEEGSLPHAMAMAAGLDDVTLDLTDLRGILTLTNNLPPVTGKLSIIGPNPELLSLATVYPYPARHFTVHSNGILHLSSLQLRGGRPGANVSGGSLYNAGSLFVSNCVFAQSKCDGGFGGAIFNSGLLRVQNTAFASNHVCGGAPTGIKLTNIVGSQFTTYGGSGAGMGGAIFVEKGSAEFLECDFLANSSEGGGIRSFCFSPGGLILPPGSGGGPEGGAPGEAGGFGSGGGLDKPGGFGASQGGETHYVEPAFFYSGQGPSYGFAGGLFVKSGKVSLSSCRFQNNMALGAEGFRSGTPSSGGAIYIYDGAVAMTNCLISANAAEGRTYAIDRRMTLGVPGSGGGIHMRGGQLWMDRCAGISNRLSSPHNSKPSRGSVLHMEGGDVWILNSTFSQNVIRGERGYGSEFSGASNPGDGGGAAFSVSGGKLHLEHSTIAFNHGYQGDGSAGIILNCESDSIPPLIDPAGGIRIEAGEVRLRANIIAQNGVFLGRCFPEREPSVATFMEKDGVGAVESLGYNIIGTPLGMGGFGPLDLVFVQPTLLPLQYSDELTPLHPLGPGSIGVNAVPLADLTPTDQWELSRPQGPLGDIGAYESPGDLTVQKPIRVGPQQSLALAPGSSGELFANAWSLEPATYQWYQNGRALAGAVGSSIAIDPMTSEKVGKYTVRVTNRGGTIENGPFSLGIAPAPAELSWVYFASNSVGWSPIQVLRSNGNMAFASPASARFVGVDDGIVPGNFDQIEVRQFTPEGKLGRIDRVPHPTGTFPVGFLAAAGDGDYRAVVISHDSRATTNTFTAHSWNEMSGATELLSQIIFPHFVGDYDVIRGWKKDRLKYSLHPPTVSKTSMFTMNLDFTSEIRLGDDLVYEVVSAFTNLTIFRDFTYSGNGSFHALFENGTPAWQLISSSAHVFFTGSRSNVYLVMPRWGGFSLTFSNGEQLSFYEPLLDSAIGGLVVSVSAEGTLKGLKKVDTGRSEIQAGVWRSPRRG